MSVSTSIFSTVMLSLLVLPLFEILKSLFNQDNNNLWTYLAIAKKMYAHPFEVLSFLILYGLALFASWSFKEMAFNIYDRLEVKENFNKRLNKNEKK